MSETGRRSEQVRGWVSFPLEDPQYKNTGEGGLFVRLVVVPIEIDSGSAGLPWDEYARLKSEQEWQVCMGGSCCVLYDETFLGDDRHPDPPKEALYSGENPAEAYHFPSFSKRYGARGSLEGVPYAYISREYLCALLIGSTGWSGWNEKEGEYFRCRFENLTEEGKSLYKAIEKLYEGKGTIYLQTWLDT